MESVKILIVDDEVLIAEDIKDTLISFGIKKIAMAHEKDEAIKMVDYFAPDVVLLDIRMENETDGIEIGKYVANNTQKTFIYITAHSDVEMINKIIKTKPIAYITKPVKKSDLYASISLAIEKIKSIRKNVLKIKNGYSFILVPYDSILYIKSDGNYVDIYCTEKKYAIRQSLDSILLDLDESIFLKIHRSYIVNTNKIIQFSKKEVVIQSLTLPVSRSLGDKLEHFMSD